MQVQNSYFWFKEALTPDQCQKIIDLGVSEIERIKKLAGQQRQLLLVIIINKV